MATSHRHSIHGLTLAADRPIPTLAHGILDDFALLRLRKLRLATGWRRADKVRSLVAGVFARAAPSPRPSWRWLSALPKGSGCSWCSRFFSSPGSQSGGTSVTSQAHSLLFFGSSEFRPPSLSQAPLSRKSHRTSPASPICASLTGLTPEKLRWLRYLHHRAVAPFRYPAQGRG